MLFDKKSFNGAAFQEIVNEVLGQVQVQKYAGGAIPPGVRTNPIKDGDIPNSENKIHFPGYFAANTTTQYQPGVVDSYIDPATNQLKVITDSREFYPGCYARAKVHAYWFDVDGNKGIGLSIGNIQKVKDGEPMGGGRPATQDFEQFEGDVVDTVVAQAPAPQPQYAQPQPQYAQPQPQYAAPQQPAYAAPQPQYAQPQPQYAAPQQPVYAPQPAYTEIPL